MHYHGTTLQLDMLLSDWLVWGLVLIIVATFFWLRRYEHWRTPCRRILGSSLGLSSAVILSFYIMIGLLDCVHMQIQLPNQQQSHQMSVLDLLISPLGQKDEQTYSAPFATHLLSQSVMILPDGVERRGYPRLLYGGAYLNHPALQKNKDIARLIATGLIIGIATYLLLGILFITYLSLRERKRWCDCFLVILRGHTAVAWREAWLTFGVLWIFLWVILCTMTHYHILGTDKVGRDVFYEAIKSIRTGMLIGTLTTLFMLPFALFLGTLAGYFRGWIDDIVQYIYITLSSIPGVLLIAATILVLQVYMSNHAHLFPNLAERADARLLILCLILGVTSWADLCRLLRGETLKLRQLEFAQAAKVLGASEFKIILRHMIPNVMHIVIITLVLDFSGLVLAEAVLSYVGVGVDPTMMSWGNMINSSRLELAREPVIWWPLLAALIFMFALVLAANIFADVVRDAFDPRGQA